MLYMTTARKRNDSKRRVWNKLNNIDFSLSLICLSQRMYFCAIDQGTSSTRAIVFDMDEATVVADHQIEFKSEYPKPGYVHFPFIRCFADGSSKIRWSFWTQQKSMPLPRNFIILHIDNPAFLDMFLFFLVLHYPHSKDFVQQHILGLIIFFPSYCHCKRFCPLRQQILFHSPIILLSLRASCCLLQWLTLLQFLYLFLVM